MISKINSIAINWLYFDIIEVEVDINNWLPSFTIVWLPDKWVQESKERLRSAIKSSNFKIPSSRITVNMAPADIKKTGPIFDLSIAVWILLNQNVLSNFYIKKSIFIWELSLDWRLRRVEGVLPSVIWAKENWFKRIFIPIDNSYEVSIIPWIDIIWVESLSDLINQLNKNKPLNILEKIDFLNFKNKFEKSIYDFKYILWQEHAKRALEIAASWWHNIIMSWPPWSWKTMLSKTFSTILPDMTIDESIEVSKIYSICWYLDSNNPLIIKRPFRAVHHTASSISIIWWWRNAKPWEISLAHRWVLFLDEILEFNKSVLEVLRQPLEDWEININRANASFKYPSKFILVWSMNPCPCWFLTDPDRECIDSAEQIKKYRSKLSWPLVDRIDLFIEVSKVDTNKFKVNWDYSNVETSLDIKNRVEKSRKIQELRFKWSNLKFNSEMTTKDINKYCHLNIETEEILKKAVDNMNLSARSYYRIIKLSRTIADLDWAKDIEKHHLLEAIGYRKKDDN